MTPVPADRVKCDLPRLGEDGRALCFSDIVESVLAQELIQPADRKGWLTAVGKSVTATHI